MKRFIFQNDITIQNRLKNKEFSLHFFVFMFIFFDFSLNTPRAIKKEEGKISKTKHAVFVQYQVDQTY
jgi:hypothetical protein